ncbi:MAG: cytochrome c biogenesis protein [Actinobacteria bacterium]|nr:cytochrome c biogenesis protein [Actinomycetota bacterium]
MEKLAIIAFWLAAVASITASLMYIKNFFAKVEKKDHVELATLAAAAAFMLLITSILIRVGTVGFERSASPFMGRAIFAMFITGVYLMIEMVYARRAPRVRVLGAFVMPVVVIFEFLAWHVYRLNLTLTDQLKSAWVGMHVTFAVSAYAAMTVAVGMAVVYLLQERQLKNKKAAASAFLKRFPSLEASDSLCNRSIVLSFSFLTLVIGTGIIRAEMLPEWSQWYQDVKILAAVATWLVFGFYLGVRTLFDWRGRRANVVAIIGFFAGIFTYFANYLLPSIHSYGKGF